MASKQTKGQKATVERVMHEFKEGELKTGTGAKVKNPKQAIAIALSESGASNQQSPKENKQRLSKTKAKERKGETAQAAKEGKKAQDRTLAKGRGETKSSGGRSKSSGSSGDGKSKAELYEMAKKQDIAGRSKMSKEQLERALR